MWSTKRRRDASGMTISGHSHQKAGSIKATSICPMESWMKRGFLQTSKSDSKPTAAFASKDIIQADRRPERVVNSPNKQQEPSPLTKIKISCVPNDFGEFVQFPAIGDLPAARGEPINTTVVKLPSHGTPYTVSLLYPGAKEAIAAIPGFPSPYMPSLQVHYRIGDVPGIGKGMFALTDLNVGDVILRERPLCLVPLCMGKGPVTAQQVHLTTFTIVASMEPQDRRDFCELTTCKPGPRSYSWYHIYQCPRCIMRTWRLQWSICWRLSRSLSCQS
jgi:hypothetical protein